VLPAEQFLENLQEHSQRVKSSNSMVSLLCQRLGGTAGQMCIKCDVRRGLTEPGHSIEDGVQVPMRFWHKSFALFSFSLAALLIRSVMAQNPPSPEAKPPNKIQKSDPQTRITIEVSGGDKDMPVENASVYVKYVEEHIIKKNKKLELNVKTNRDGVAHVPDAPLGRALVQIIAEGWKPYGRWFDITEAKQVIKIHLERPPKWY
jgi:hypothetical protein